MIKESQFNVKKKTVKLLEENIKNLCDLELRKELLGKNPIL
jgi:hypothetical protein